MLQLSPKSTSDLFLIPSFFFLISHFLFLSYSSLLFRTLNNNIFEHEILRYCMEIKPRPNHSLYLKSLRQMTPEQRLAKVFELSRFTKELFLQGLQKRFPDKGETEIKEIYLQRLLKCYNRNY